MQAAEGRQLFDNSEIRSRAAESTTERAVHSAMPRTVTVQFHDDAAKFIFSNKTFRKINIIFALRNFFTSKVNFLYLKIIVQDFNFLDT